MQLDHLPTGDYLIDNEALVERKSVGDLAASLIDGRLFPQVARLAHSGYRTLLLIEGPPPASMPGVNPHSIEGALVSIAAMWRLPVLHASDSEQSVRMLRFLAEQVRGSRESVLRRFDRKPKRLASRRLFLLQGLPGVGPALARRLLDRFGSIEGVLTADAFALTGVSGIGAKKPRGSGSSSVEMFVRAVPLVDRKRPAAGDVTLSAAPPGASLFAFEPSVAVATHPPAR